MSIVKTVYIEYSRFYQLASLYTHLYIIYMSIDKIVYIVYSRFYQLASVYIHNIHVYSQNCIYRMFSLLSTLST
jgi:hypothetical protein